MSEWQQVLDELDAWHQAGKTARLWLRDDDAVEPSEALDQLLETTGRHGVPLLLCVVPEHTSLALRDELRGQDHVRIAVHGHGHHNHAPAGEKAQELGSHRPAATVAGELAQARAKLTELYDGQLSAILVPPWNRIAPEVVAQLPKIGFAGLSTFGAAFEAEGVDHLVQLNTHLDIIDWKGTRGGRDPAWLRRELVRLLEASRAHGGDPIGVLAHHLVHDDAAWDFLDALFAHTAGHPAVTWCAADDLIEGDQAG